MNEREAAARAISFLERCDDREFLMGIIRDVAPRARRMSGEAARREGEENVPGPASVPPSSIAATAGETQRLVRELNDFPLLQAIARAAGRRLESLRAANGSLS